MIENKILNISLDNTSTLDIEKLLKRSSCNIWELRSENFLKDKEDLAITIIKKLKGTGNISMPVTFSKRIIYESLPDMVMASTFWSLDQILESLEYATLNFLPCTLVIFSDSRSEVRESYFTKALEAKKRFPNVKLQIRCDWTPLQDLLKFLKENNLEEEWLVDLPLCIAEKYNLNVEDTIISETYDSVNGLASYNFLKKIRDHIKYSKCKECKSINNCWGICKGNPSLKNYINPLKSEKFYRNTNDLCDDMYSIHISKNNLEPPYSSQLDLPLSFRNHKFSRDLVFKHPNIIEFFTLKEPVYYISRNVPEVFEKDDRGIYSLSFPFIGKDLVDTNPLLKEKSKKEYFISANGFLIVLNIAFNPNWDFHTQKFLENLVLNKTEKIIIKYGDPEEVIRRERDILYRGYRVVAGIWKFIPNRGLAEDIAFYCGEIEKNYEDLLQPKERININRGITEMIPSLTKEVFITELERELKEVIKCLK
jgi:hypothetical protein|nr:MAG TPA_asm: hypothetical protein [Caudoviricetes sp.]